MSAQPQAAMESKTVQTGAEAVVASLIQNDVKVVFGMTGGMIMPVYDAMYRHSDIRHIMVGHEQGAAHMADGYARITGKPGVVMTTSGPGATNLVTGLANAMMDSIPMVALTGQINSQLLGSDGFQEADMWGITLPVTKHNYQVTDPETLADVFAEAFLLCQTGRPGPVLIDLPRDVLLAQCSRSLAVPSEPVGYHTPYAPKNGSIGRAIDLFMQAKKPMILAGGGVISAGASRELTALAEKLQVPVATTLMGLGTIPARHPLALGMPGMHGQGYTNLALHGCDLLFVVGCRLDDRVTGKVARFAPEAKLIHIDIDDSELNKILPAAVPILGNAKPCLQAMLDELAEAGPLPDYSAWRQEIEDLKARYPRSYKKAPDLIAPPQAVEALIPLMEDDDVLVTGVGQHQMYAAQFYPVQTPRSFVSSGGLGTMGFGLPAAIGAKLAAPDKQVVCIDGDGCFLMNLQELNTAVRYNIGLVVVILNNSYLGMVRQWQDLFLDKRRAETRMEPPPYDKVAQAFGGLGRRVEKEEDLAPALEWALTQARLRNLPVVVDVQVDPDALVLPMVPAGGANADFIPCQEEVC